MKTLVTQLFGRFKAPLVPGVSPTTGHSSDNALGINDGSENANRQRLVHGLMRELLSKSGIPQDLIECQMFVVTGNAGSDGVDVRLIIKQWDARLMNYAFAFQQTLHQNIEQLEPNASEWLRGISWQLDMNGTCPYTALPGKAFWQQPLKMPHQRRTLAVRQDPMQELEGLFAERDHEFARKSDQGQPPVGYEETLPAPL